MQVICLQNMYIKSISISKRLYIKHNKNLQRPYLGTSRRTVVSDGRDWTRQSDWTGLICFMFAGLLSSIILLFLLSSAVSLSYFNFAVPIRKCLGTLVHEFPIFYSHTEWNLLSSGTILFCSDVPAIKQLNYKQRT